MVLIFLNLAFRFEESVMGALSLITDRFKLVLGHVENPLEKRTVRRQIARLNTIISEFDQGIRKA